MAYKTGTNLFSTPSTYNRYYRDFRGVDFSSDHTEVNLNRFAYLVNMYKDYRNGQGVGVETIPGYRKIPVLTNGTEVKDLIDMEYFRLAQGNTMHKYVAILYRDSQPTAYKIAVVDLEATNGFNNATIVNGSAGEFMTCFEFRGRFYLISGGVFNYLYLVSNNLITGTLADVFSDSEQGQHAYIPTTYIGIKPADNGEVANVGVEYEQRNFLTGMFKNTILADGEHSEYALSEPISSTETDYGLYLARAYGVNFTIVEDNSVPVFYPTITQPSALAGLIGTGTLASASVNGTSVSITKKSGATVPTTTSAIGLVVNDQTVTVPSSYNVMLYTYVVHTAEGEDVTYAGAVLLYAKKSATYPNVVEFYNAIPAPERVGYPEGYSGVEITARGGDYVLDSAINITGKSAILGCRLATVFDNRVFLTGNPKLPNHIFWCGIPAEKDGVPDPTYFGALNFEQDGIGQTPNMGMFPVADTLCVIKNDTVTDGVVYYHTPVVQDNNIVPKIYPSTRGISGQGCISLGGAINFRDDPVFVTREGIDAIGQLSARYERATEHRSSLVDVKLRSYDLTKAKLEVYDGYLLVLTDDGHVFMADSRQMYTDKTGVGQYEWFMLDGIGSYDGQYDAYRFGKHFPSADFLEDPRVKELIGNINLEIADNVYDASIGIKRDMRGLIANPNGELEFYIYNEQGDGEASIVEYQYDDDFEFASRLMYDENGVAHYYYLEHAMQCNGNYEQTGGDFHPAKFIKTVGDDLYIGTVDGLYKFNFDLRMEDGSFAPFRTYENTAVDTYARDGRCYESGCATLMDNCGIPHLEKKTVTKTLVIKTKSEKESVAKLRVRTNRKSYEQIARLGDGNLDFYRMDFSETAFTATPNSLFAIKEKERHWVEKQYYLYNDEFNKSFCLYYIAYQYQVQGKYKNK